MSQTKPDKFKSTSSVNLMPMIGKEVHKYVGQSDAEIWQSYLSGDDDALIFIYNNYVGGLLRFGLQFAPREMVKDSIQDLFLNLKNRRKKRTLVQRITPYLYKAIYRIIKSKLERYKNLITSDGLDQIKQWNIHVSEEINLIRQEHRLEQSKHLQNSMNELSEKQRQAVLLFYYEGLTHQEIADIMGLRNKSSVRKLIYRALDSLKRYFDE